MTREVKQEAGMGIYCAPLSLKKGGVQDKRLIAWLRLLYSGMTVQLRLPQSDFDPALSLLFVFDLDLMSPSAVSVFSKCLGIRMETSFLHNKHQEKRERKNRECRQVHTDQKNKKTHSGLLLHAYLYSY